VETPARESLHGRPRGGAGLDLVAPRVQGTRVQEDEVLLVAGFGAARLDQGGRARGSDLEELERAVVGDEARAAGDELARERRVADADLPRRAPTEVAAAATNSPAISRATMPRSTFRMCRASLSKLDEWEIRTWGTAPLPAGRVPWTPNERARVCADSARKGSDFRHTDVTPA
jgi:hypothetical protein